MKKKLNFSIILFIILLPFFKTDYIVYAYPKLNNIINIFKIISIMLILIIILKSRYVSKKMILLLAFMLSIILPTIIYSGDMITATDYCISIFCLACLMDFYKKDERFLSTLLLCFEIVIYINLITMIVKPNGLYSTGTIYTGIATQNWFLGFKNTMIMTLLPAYVVSGLYKNITNRKKRYYCLNIAIFISSVLSTSSTTIVGMFVLYFFECLKLPEKYYKFLNIANYMKTFLILFVSIVILRMQYLFSFLLVDILHKDLTFTNRTNLWDITINQILKNPVFGHGWANDSTRHLMYNSQTVITAHNQVLEYLYLGGFLCLIILALLYICSKREIKDKYGDKNIQLISLSFFTFLIISLTEVFLDPLMIIVFLSFVFSKNYILEEKNEKY